MDEGVECIDKKDKPPMHSLDNHFTIEPSIILNIVKKYKEGKTEELIKEYGDPGRIQLF